MKKKLVILSIMSALVLCVFGMANALSYTDMFNTDPSPFTVVDRSSTVSGIDVYNSTYFGYTGNDYDGYYIGTVTYPTNTQEGGTDYLELFINAYIEPDITNYEEVKSDEDSSLISLTFLDEEQKTGTWTLIGTYAEKEANFYAVKGGLEWSVYYLLEPLSSGDWTTRHILNPSGNQPEISHLSASIVDPVNEVPEPATMLLFGTGLVGLAGVARRRNKK